MVLVRWPVFVLVLDETEAEGLAGGTEKHGVAGKSARKTRGGELYDAFAGGSDEDEDCLFVNVWTPSDASPESRLPVWVFISGGGE